jgi:Tol biopolymer transport system component
MNADGSNIQRLTNVSNTLDWSPDWSPDGSQIVFARSYSSPTWRSEIWAMNADGSNLHRLGNVEGQGPDWSPDGSKIVYFNYVEGGGDIWIMNADGTNPIKLTENPAEDWWPKFSPDGSKIAFQSKRDGNHEIYVMNSDGSNPVRLTNNSADDEDPNWSPDGTKIAFISMRVGHYEIYIMNADGSNQTRITTTNGHAIDPDWKPFTNPTSVKESGHLFNSLPEKFALFQNYPNPFNSSTTIRYRLSHPVKMRLQIFDVLGRLVLSLIDDHQPAGDHQICWDGTNKDGWNAGTGIYLCQLTADRYTYTNKLLLIK